MVILLAAIVSGCGNRADNQLAISSDGSAVIQDAYDGHLNHNWSCGSLRAAFQRLPTDGVYQTLPVMIGEATAKRCDSALAGLRVGGTRAQVQQQLGRPNSGHRCWVLQWPPADEGQALLYKVAHPSKPLSNVDGARVCFRAGRVRQIQTAMHG